MNTLTETLAQINKASKFGDLKKLAKEIKKNHTLALKLWETGQYYPRLLAVLILDRKLVDQVFMDKIATDLKNQRVDEWNQILDWLYANQLKKSKKLIAMVEKWRTSESPVLRKLFWTHQYRIRWTGKTGHDNTDEIIGVIEETIMSERRLIQETMVMTAGWIGVYNLAYRDRLIILGEDTELFKDVEVPPGCTSWYLPDFIRTEAEKRGL